MPWWWWYFVHRAHASPRCPAPGKNNRSYPNHRHNTEKKPKTDVLVRYFYPRLRTSANSIKIPTKFYLPTLHGLSNVIIIYLVSFSFIIYIYIYIVEKREANQLQYCERFLHSSPKIESRPFDTTDLLSCIFFFFLLSFRAIDRDERRPARRAFKKY